MGGLMAYLIKIIKQMGENVVKKIQMKTPFVYSGHQNKDVKNSTPTILVTQYLWSIWVHPTTVL